MKQFSLLACLALLIFSERTTTAGEVAAPVVQQPMLFFDDFQSGCADRWEPGDPKAWKVVQQNGGYVYSQHQASKITNPFRAPFNRSMIKDITVGDFVFDVHVQSTIKDYPHRDVCLFFGYQDPAHFYYVHLGKRMDAHANNIFIVNGAPRIKISKTTTKGTNWDDEWHRVRIVRDVESGSIRIYFDDMNNPVMTAEDKSFSWGQVGVGTFDDTGNYDNVFLFGERVEEPTENNAPDGFYALFNGSDLGGWKGLVGSPKTRATMSKADMAKAQAEADKKMRDHWKAVDGVLVFDGKGQSLCTLKDYGDFEMFVDWKIHEKGDSGIYLRGSPQVQIWDPALQKVGSGGLYNNQKNPSKPTKTADKAIGEWNTFRIKMIGKKVTVWLNSELVVDNVTLENYWERDKPIYSTGQIELQNHGNTLYFKNIYIREIPRGKK